MSDRQSDAIDAGVATDEEVIRDVGSSAVHGGANDGSSEAAIRRQFLANEKLTLEIASLRAAVENDRRPQHAARLTFIVGSVNAVIALVVALAGFRACDEAQSAHTAAVEAEARVQGRLTPTLSVSFVEHPLGAPPGIYDVVATLSSTAAAAQPVAIRSITYRLWLQRDGLLGQDGGVPLGGRTIGYDTGVPPDMGPQPGADAPGAAAVLGLFRGWEKLDDVSFPFPESSSCNVLTGTPSEQCQLDGVGRYSQGESMTSSRSWRLAFPAPSSIWVTAKISWCRYASQSAMDNARGEVLTAGTPKACTEQTPWTLAARLMLCGYERFSDCVLSEGGAVATLANVATTEDAGRAGAAGRN